MYLKNNVIIRLVNLIIPQRGNKYGHLFSVTNIKLKLKAAINIGALAGWRDCGMAGWRDASLRWRVPVLDEVFPLGLTLDMMEAGGERGGRGSHRFMLQSQLKQKRGEQFKNADVNDVVGRMRFMSK